MQDVKEDLKKALALLGPNGENWVKNPIGTDFWGNRYCVITACSKVTDETYGKSSYDLTAILRKFLPARAKVGPYHPAKRRGSNHFVILAHYNDAEATKFEDVRELFNKAIASL